MFLARPTRTRWSRCVINFGLAKSFLPYSKEGWRIVIENLCLYEHQTIDGLLASPAQMVASLHDAALDKAKLIKNLQKKKKR